MSVISCVILIDRRRPRRNPAGVDLPKFVTSARSSPYRPEPLNKSNNLFIKYHIQGIVRM